jgi:aldose 1-epimerase
LPHPSADIFLREGHLTVGLAPHCGGALTRFEIGCAHSALEILRPARTGTSHPYCSLGTSCFPLIPYAGRLRDGRFELEGRSFRLPLNAPPERHSSHGDGWTRSWSLTHLDRRSAIMTLGADDVAPFRYQFTQLIIVEQDRLSIELSAGNLSDHRIPMGFGLHPYFSDRAGAFIRAKLPSRWRWDAEMMPTSREVNPHASGLLCGQAVAQLPVAVEYADWDGRAFIDWPQRGLRVELTTTPTLHHAVVWIPDGENFFCFEPMSHATDGFNRRLADGSLEDILILDPGAVARQRFDFIVSRTGSARI